MKKTVAILLMVAFIMCGCGGGKNAVDQKAVCKLVKEYIDKGLTLTASGNEGKLSDLEKEYELKLINVMPDVVAQQGLPSSRKLQASFVLAPATNYLRFKNDCMKMASGNPSSRLCELAEAEYQKMKKVCRDW